MHRQQHDQVSVHNVAQEFINQCYIELGKDDQITARNRDVAQEIDATGTWSQTFEELEHGARMAWRNSNRCIGRMPWRSLMLRDYRHLVQADEIAEALSGHLLTAFSGGRIRPVITVFRPGTRILNHQLIRYAGYRQPDGTTIGDPASTEFTEQCQALGWKGAGTRFDVLPWIIQVPGNAPVMFPVPEHTINEVTISHPAFNWFRDLGLRWYAIPVISDMEMDIGGVVYTAAPFNGWYMQTEIAARNFADTNRYNMLPAIAERMGLDTSRNETLWRDRALLELNVALLHSFDQHGVRIVDHHTADRQFSRFIASEKRAGRRVTGDWIWLVPPMAPATTDTFSRKYRRDVRSPNFFYRQEIQNSGQCPITGAPGKRPLNMVAHRRY